MRYKEVDYNGKKLKIKVFDYDTPEGWREFIENTAGSVKDDTFVAPPDGYTRDEDLERCYNITIPKEE